MAAQLGRIRPGPAGPLAFAGALLNLLLLVAMFQALTGRWVAWRRRLQPPLTEPDRRVLAALSETEECRPEETVEVRFSSEADGPSGGRS